MDSELLVTRAPGYELRLRPDQLDLQRFEDQAAAGRAALAAGDAAAAAEKLKDALGLWRGQPLADLVYEQFAQAEIARLEELRLSVVEDRLEAGLELGRHGDLVGELEALAAEHPLRERLRGQLMRALYRAGRQAEALEAYRNARRALAEELGIEPSRDLRELQEAILRQDPALDRAPMPAVGSEPSRGLFVGRRRELTVLTDSLADALAGRGRLVLLVGEPGIGKSRLAEVLIGEARERGARVLVGRCWEAGGAPAYWPWVQALRSYVREAEPDTLRSELGLGAADLAQMIPELRQRVPDLPEPSAIESEGARFRLFDATAEFLRNASRSRPIVLVLDDLHAADAPSLLLLQFLARELGSTRVLLLGAYRDVDPIPGQPLTGMLGEVAREPITRRIVLGGLAAREVAEYVELAASEIASRELVATVHEETEGNPLFVGEIVRLLSAEGVRSGVGGEGRLAVPRSVRDVIARRLTHLSEECNRVLLLASVMGREFALDTLAHLANVSVDGLLETLDEAMVARVLSEDPGGPGRIRFAHVLIRDTLYDGLTTARRVVLHRRAGTALEALYGDGPGPHLAELAHHAVAGGDFDNGVRYAWRAGDHALALLAYEEAARLYKSALDAGNRRDVRDETARCKLLVSLGEAEGRAGNTPAAKIASLEAAGLARRLALSRELARAAAAYGGVFSWQRAGTDTRLVPLLEEGVAALSDEDVELRVRLLARLAGALRDEPSRDRRDKLSGRAVELARRTGHPAALAHALNGRAAAIQGPDTLDEVLALGGELRDLAGRIGDKERMLDAHAIRLIVWEQMGSIADAEVELAAAARITDELRQPTYQWEVCAGRAAIALFVGRLKDAEELVEQAVEIGGRAQPAEAIPVHRLQRYALCDLRGGLEEVEQAIREVAAEYPARPMFRCALAHIHARLGRLQEAERTLHDLGRHDFSGLPFDQEWLLGMSLIAETCALMDDTGCAPIVYRLLLPWARLNAADHPEGMRGSISRYLGLLATTMARWNEAEGHFDDALEANERMGARPWLAHTQRDYARMLLARDAAGDGERAKEFLSHARATYEELGVPAAAASLSTPTAETGR